MKFVVEFNIDNACFERIPCTVIAQMLQKIAKKLPLAGYDIPYFHDQDGPIIDLNGNHIGYYGIVKE